MSDPNLWFVAALFALVGILYARQGWINFIQVAIFALVVSSNIHWQWTPNPILASVVGALAAGFATFLLTRAWSRQ